jgi:glycosyltransferase involved in cell wall biosynthesis
VQAHRILVLTSTYPRWVDDAAVPPFVHELTRRLTAGFEMHVLAPHAPGAAVEEVLDGVQVHRFHYLPERWQTLAYGGGMLPGLRRRPWRAAGLLPFLAAEHIAARRLLAGGGFGLIHAHWAIPHGLIGAGIKANRALLCTSHGSDLFALGKWARPFQRRALVHADAVTVVSGALRTKARDLTGVDARVMPMGVDMQRFTPPPSGAARDGILYVGRLVRDKGVQVLLHALAELGTRGLTPALRVVGSGSAEAWLKALVRELRLQSQVEFLGARPNQELPPLYRAAEMLVFPSLLGPQGQQEGMGLVPVEALACGCPVVASRLPAVSEVVRDEETGLLCQPGDAGSLAACIERFLREPELGRATAAAGTLQVAARYTWDGVTAGYGALYQELLDRA